MSDHVGAQMPKHESGDVLVAGSLAELEVR